jgi:hypothetical protein
LRINSSIQQVKDIKPNKSHTPRLWKRPLLPKIYQ